MQDEKHVRVAASKEKQELLYLIKEDQLDV